MSTPTTSELGSSITVEALDADPFPIYARLRDEEPVCFVPAVGLHLVTRWDDVHHVATHPDVFTAEVDASPLVRTLGVNVLTVDGADHARMRAGMDAPMRPRAVEGYAPGVIEPIARRHLDAMAGEPGAELMSAYCEPVSVLALGAVMGLGDLDADTLRRWFGDLATGGANFEQDPEKQAVADATSAEIDARVGPLLDRLEREPDGSVLAHMLAADATRAEVLSNLKLILLGGMQEPGHALGICVWALLTHPETLERVRADRGLIRPAVEEALRWHSPVGTQTRQVTQPVTLSGVKLAPGDALAAVLASANRDERHWADPDRYDIDRRGAHAAFGLGAHHCAGAPLARYEVRLPLEMLLDRFPNLRLDPAHEVELSGWEFRAPTAVHVLWN
ncbi:MAG TPA: cytochrome P450 [Gaiellales bacterium]|nr:cytochrome P450 [Gaiellales bacterium]